MNPPDKPPSVDVIEANRRLTSATPAPLLVDVREPYEFANVRVAGAALMPMSTFAAQFRELPADRPLLVMCAVGGRSAVATAHLLATGYPDVLNVAGGIVDWERAGLPVRRGTPTADEGALPEPG
jgi:rhodanese-related sulfurtransferase